MNDKVKNTVLKTVMSIHDSDVGYLDILKSLKDLPLKAMPLDVVEFLAQEITRRNESVKRLQEFALKLESK